MPPIHILHVAGLGMNRGGTETWLMQVLRHCDRKRFQMDFLVMTTEPCAYDDEVLKLGSRIIACPHPLPMHAWAFTRRFRRILRDFGPYDIVHSHLPHCNGYVMRLAHQAKVPVRIAHFHDNSVLWRAKAVAKAGPVGLMGLALFRWWTRRHATMRLAVSRRAAASYLGPAWQTGKPCRILASSIDLLPFRTKPDRASVRAEVGIPEDAFVVAHVGGFRQVKNHSFLVEVMAEVVRREPRAYGLLVGDGALRPRIEEQVAHKGLTNQVVFAGERADVPRLMMGAMDAFVFPSIAEGLGRVVVEAQAAGLPCVVSDAVPEEAYVVRSLVQQLSLTQPPRVWAEAVLSTRHKPSPTQQQDALAAVEQSALEIHACVRELERLYTACLAETKPPSAEEA